MKNNTITAVDIGSFEIKILTVQQKENGSYIKFLIKTPTIDKNGERNIPKSLKYAIESMEEKIDKSIENVYIAFQDTMMKSIVTTTSKKFNKTSTIIEDDLSYLEEKIINKIDSNNSNYSIIYNEAISYLVDDIQYKEPLKRKVNKSLNVSYSSVIAPEHVFNDTMNLFSELGIEIVDFLPSPIASAYTYLTLQSKEAGSMVVDLGFRNTSIAVYDDSTLVYLNIFKGGIYEILKVLAVKIKIPMEEILNKKIHHTTKRSDIESIITQATQKHLQKIRVQLEDIEKKYLLAGGVIVCGGGGSINNIDIITKKVFKLPLIRKISNEKYGKEKSELSVVFGLIKYAIENKDSNTYIFGRFFDDIFTYLKRMLKRLYANIS